MAVSSSRRDSAASATPKTAGLVVSVLTRSPAAHRAYGVCRATASAGSHRPSSSSDTVRAAVRAASRIGADARSPGCSRASAKANSTSSESVTPASSITSFRPHPVYQGTVPSNRQPAPSRRTRTGRRGYDRRCAYATPDSSSPRDSGPNSLSRTGSSLRASVCTGVWCWVCTNQVAQHAPDRISAVARSTAGGAPAPPYSAGAATPSSPDRFTASMWLAGTHSWSTRSASGISRSVASRRARTTSGCEVRSMREILPLFPSTRSPDLPAMRHSGLPDFRTSRLPGFPASRLPGFRRSGDFSATVARGVDPGPRRSCRR